MKTFIESHFNYCPLKWMFHSRTMNNKISRKSKFNELLKKDESFSIHHRNIQTLAVIIYKFFHVLSLSIMKNTFQVNTNNRYSLRSLNELYSKTVKCRTETISYLAPRIWSLLPEIIKSSKKLDIFKKKNEHKKKMET